MIAKQVQDKLAELNALTDAVRARLVRLDVQADRVAHAELSQVLDELMVASANLRVLLPEPVPGNDAAKFAAALSDQRARQTRRTELMEGIVDGDGSMADRAASRP
jgi:hypothetical protein